MLVPGSKRTYANRKYLRGLGLLWDPERQRWHGVTTLEEVGILRWKLGLEVRCFGTLDGPGEPTPSSTMVATPPPLSVPPPAATVVPRWHSPRRMRDGSRARFESRIALPEVGEESKGWEGRQFSLLEITSGLPDDSREADEREVERRLRDLRGRVEAARAVIARTPGLFDLLAREPDKARMFCARRGIAERTLVDGADAGDLDEDGLADVFERLLQPLDSPVETRARATAMLPGSWLR